MGVEMAGRQLQGSQTELDAVEEALAATRWNRKAAAMRLNISYKALLNKVKQYRLRPPSFD
jgi:two-component system, NtrC family, response regulator AtoC